MRYVVAALLVLFLGVALGGVFAAIRESEASRRRAFFDEHDKLEPR